ncbi:hypothetical protein BDR05DRAFT_1048825 [Suillus weaverae]|nr:hypothetical protein BDR05DRAFT_1048825 [Suillus weaverae]
MHATLSSVQADLCFAGAGSEVPIVSGRSCGHIFSKGECCFHCNDYSDHNVSFFVTQQAGGCCDCGDIKAWRNPILCPFHPLAPHVQAQIEQSLSAVDATPLAIQHSISEEILFVENCPYRIPPNLHDLMSHTIAYALDFILNTLDYSPDEATPSADPMQKDQYAIVIWNDDKHSFEEVIKLICKTTGHHRKVESIMAHSIDDVGQEIMDINAGGRYTNEIITAELLSPRQRQNTFFISGPQIPNLAADLTHPCHIDWLFVYHTRLWRKPRIHWKAIYASILILSLSHKIAIVSHFASIYHHVTDAYLLVDREAETSIKYFTLQLFTAPSVALHIVSQHDLMTRLLDIIINFFTDHIEDKHILTTSPAQQDIDVDSPHSEAANASCPSLVISGISVTTGLSNSSSLITQPSYTKKVFKVDAALYQIVDFNVLEGWVSLHHSLHWLLADLLKHVDILLEESLNWSNYDFAVLAMIAQIRAGLWVHNGFPICGQLLHYCNLMLCAHLLSMVEELLYILITILGKRTSGTKLPFQCAIHRKIRMVDDVSFGGVLKDISHFRAPESTSDTGMYELKDEAYDKVDPFTFHYTRNKREEVEVILKNRLWKKTGVKDLVIVLKPLAITSGPFSILPSILESEALLQVMFYAIYNVIALTNSVGMAPPSAEAILNQTFQLIMLALVERPSVFKLHHWVLTEISKHVPEGMQPPCKVLSPSVLAPDVEGVKKRAAKACQEAIMAEMKAQQASFPFNFKEEEEENDQDMDEVSDELSSYDTCIVCQEDLNEGNISTSLWQYLHQSLN